MFRFRLNNLIGLITLFISSITILSSCSMKTNADFIFFNGLVYTVNDNFDVADAFAIKEGKFIAVGSNEQILEGYRSNNVIDLNGAPVYPGLNDAHGHLLHLGNSLMSVDLRGAKSYNEILERLDKYYKEYSPSYIVGDGWDQNLWDNPAIPDNEELSKMFPDIPVVLNRIDLHATIANKKAIELSGLRESDKSIPKGEAEIKRGRFTGLFMEETAGIVESSIPTPNTEELVELVKKAQSECFKYGLTSISDAGDDHILLNILDSLQAIGELKLRVNAMMRPTVECFEKYPEPYENGRLRIATIKLFQDGALGSRGALLLEPYSDDRGNYGISVITRSEFEETLKWAYDHGFAVSTHCIGDAANREALDGYGLFLKGKNDRRWRIEHAQIIHPDDMDKFGKFSIVPSIQPTHCTSDMFWADDRIGDRIMGAYAYKELLDQNGWLPSGTDFPIESVNPIYTFFAAVYRKNLDLLPEGGFQMENALSKEEALRSITIWAAKVSFEEDVKGSIEVGKYADFTVLDRDIMTVPEREVLGAKVLMTYVEAEEVYSINKTVMETSDRYSDKEAISNIFERKSVRRYLDKEVEQYKIDLILKAAMAAPSGKDMRPWEFVIVKDRAKMNDMANRLPYAKMLKEAPMAVVIAGDLKRSDYWYLDCSAAAQNLLLAAEALDLGAVWTAAYPYEDRMKIVAENLNFPDNIKALAVIPVGYPKGENKPKDKFNPDKIHTDSWER